MFIPVPIDDTDTYDYVPIGGGDIQVGMDILALWTVQGEVTHVFEPVDPELEELWVYFMTNENPDGTFSTGVAVFPETPGLYPDDWFQRFAIWKRADKLADGQTLTAGDGSEWIYAVNEDGRMRCYEPGSTYERGDARFRGELTTDPNDLWICDDTEWDWLPVAAGDEVEVGDTITFLSTNEGTVDEITISENEYRRTRSFEDTGDGAELGWFYDAIYSEPAVAILNVWTWFERLLKPDPEAKFLASDGSRWIYVSDDLYYCWATGTTYVSNALFNRGEIDGGLIAIP